MVLSPLPGASTLTLPLVVLCPCGAAVLFGRGAPLQPHWQRSDCTGRSLAEAPIAHGMLLTAPSGLLIQLPASLHANPEE